MSSRKLPRSLTWALQCLCACAVWLAVLATGCSNGDDSSSPGDAATPDGSVTSDAPTSDQTQSDTGVDGGSCPAGKTSCNGTCVDLTTDVNNCGRCNGPCGMGLVCSSGSCSFSCAAGTVLCQQGCFDTQTNPANCGACGTQCPPTSPVCSGGQCTTVCGPGSTLCNGLCTNTASDEQNCGACSNACGPGTVCSQGTCSLTCQKGDTACTPPGDAGIAGCSNLQQDNENCGHCNDPCTAPLVCNSGVCSTICGPGLVNCNGCIDPSTNSQYCGASGACGSDGGSPGTICPPGTSCIGGACACQQGQILCGGACVDPKSNTQYCGATSGCGVGGVGSVGTSCTGATPICSDSTCGTVCATPQILCGGTCVDPSSSTSFCGATGSCTGLAAGTRCPNGYVCAGGQCNLTCQAGLINCNNTCIDPQNDLTYCGATANCINGFQGTACPPGDVCSSGKCTLTCQTGFVDCKGKCINPLTDPDFCGAAPPSPPGSTANGLCSSATVGNANYQGQECASGNVCNGGSCSLSCQQGLVNCSGTCIDPTSDPNHCGAALPTGPTDTTQCTSTTPGTDFEGVGCALKFGAGYQCVNSQCALVCQPNQVICQGQCVDPQTDSSHCGATVTDSAKTPGQCDVAPGFPVGTAPSYGADDFEGYDCASSYGAGYACTNGTCTLTCQTGLVKCDVSGIDVVPICINPLTDPNHCGATLTDPGSVPAQCDDAPGVPVGDHPTYGDPDFQGYVCATDYGTAYTCTNGVCTLTCQSGLVKCDVAGIETVPTCINPQTDPNHCGASAPGSCNVAPGVVTDAGPTSPSYGTPSFQGYVCETEYGPGYVCSGGACSLNCVAPLQKCGNICANTTDDPNNCGGCGHICNSGVCSGSVCQSETPTVTGFVTNPGSCGSTASIFTDEGGSYGLRWPDKSHSSAAPTSIQISFNQGVQCDSTQTPEIVTLNGVSIGATFTPAPDPNPLAGFPTDSGDACTCSPPPSFAVGITITDPTALAAYVVGGANALDIANPNNATQGITEISNSVFASVVVTFP